MNNIVELELHELENVSGGRWIPDPPPDFRIKLLALKWALWLKQFSK